MIRSFGRATMFQFTRPRGARLEQIRSDPARCQVSIHAPARGATRALLYNAQHQNVSIHAPARGATPTGRLSSLFCEFQFTRPRGARLARNASKRRAVLFQFTRPRGARRQRVSGHPSGICFNSRAREGRDNLTVTGTTYNITFQFTRPRGARLRGNYIPRQRPSFNSRAREGRDCYRAGTRCLRAVSIHAPARGATWVMIEADDGEVFQFTRPRGARRESVPSSPLQGMFQFTRPRGARPLASTHPP